MLTRREKLHVWVSLSQAGQSDQWIAAAFNWQRHSVTELRRVATWTFEEQERWFLEDKFTMPQVILSRTHGGHYLIAFLAIEFVRFFF